MKPVVVFYPIDLCGVTVQRATGFNAKFILDNGIGCGTKIGIVRSGDVIPYITTVFLKGCTELPKTCPSCGSTLIVDGVELKCPSDACPEQILQSTAYFFEMMGVEEISYKTLDNLGVKTIKDCYELTRDYILSKDGFGEKKADLILSEINKTLSTKPETLLKAFGVGQVGKTMSKEICDIYNFEDLYNVTVSDLIKIKNIGEKTANVFISDMTKTKETYTYLLSKGLKFESRKNPEGSLLGMIFSITGTLPIKRNDLVNMIESQGGTVKSVTSKTNYLIWGGDDTNSDKYQKAVKSKVPIISYDEFKKLLK